MMLKMHNVIFLMSVLAVTSFTAAGITKAQSCVKMCKGLKPNQISIKPLPTGVGRIIDVIFQILKYHVISYGTTCGRKISPAPKMTTPVAFF